MYEVNFKYLIKHSDDIDSLYLAHISCNNWQEGGSTKCASINLCIMTRYLITTNTILCNWYNEIVPSETWKQ